VVCDCTPQTLSLLKKVRPTEAPLSTSSFITACSALTVSSHFEG
jgi:hypothetical protein